MTSDKRACIMDRQTTPMLSLLPPTIRSLFTVRQANGWHAREGEILTPLLGLCSPLQIRRSRPHAPSLYSRHKTIHKILLELHAQKSNMCAIENAHERTTEKRWQLTSANATNSVLLTASSLNKTVAAHHRAILGRILFCPIYKSTHLTALSTHQALQFPRQRWLL